MANNRNLNQAKKNKDDEFYTLYSTIEKEIPYYEDQFRDKTVYCNCDDPHWSNFFRYFIYNFNRLGLRRLICSCFAGKAIYGVQRDLFHEEKILSAPGLAWCADIHTVVDAELPEDKELLDVEKLITLPGNSLTRLRIGDFRSEECLDLLRQSDIVCTNPPFSLARDFIDLLVREGKEYLFLSNQLLLLCRSAIKEIIAERCRVGVSLESNIRGGCLFLRENRIVRLNGVCWITSLLGSLKKKKLHLESTYCDKKYYTCDNYNAIYIPKVELIPIDYYGLVSVPVSFLYFEYEDMFRVIGTTRLYKDLGLNRFPLVNGKKPFDRIIIQRK